MTNPASDNGKLICDFLDQVGVPFADDCDLQDEYCIVSKGLLAARAVCFPLGSLHQPPFGLPTRSAVSLVSSRLPERRDLCPWWYDIVRTTCARCDPDREYLLAVPGTTCFEAVVRASELFGIRRVEFELPEDDSASSANTVAWCHSRIEAHRSQTNRNALVTPAILTPQCAKSFDFRSEVDVPLRDVLGFDFAERIVVLHSRKNGSVHRLCQHYLKQPDDKIVMLAQTSSQPKSGQDLIDQGAVPWLLFDDYSPSIDEAEAATPIVVSPEPSATAGNPNSNADGPVQQPEQWLCHWTRPFRSAWPDQSSDEFLDELILGCPSADRSALAALMRIIQQRKLIASVARKNEATTVSMTAVPLSEFRSRRIFRAHRRRYDFEPYGVAIRKSVLVKLDAEAVQYLDDDVAVDSSIVSTSAFQQPRYDRTGKIDWSNEKEWRLVGDLDLSEISEGDVQFFVNSEVEQAQLKKVCCFPIHVVPTE